MENLNPIEQSVRDRTIRGILALAGVDYDSTYVDEQGNSNTPERTARLSAPYLPEDSLKLLRDQGVEL